MEIKIRVAAKGLRNRKKSVNIFAENYMRKRVSYSPFNSFETPFITRAIDTDIQITRKS